MFQKSTQISIEELFDGEKNSKESDIYSFGIVCFELATQRLPWHGLSTLQIFKFISEGKREEIPNTTPKEFKELIELCWNQNPKERKSFEEIITIIQKMSIIDSYNSNPKLEDMEQ